MNEEELYQIKKINEALSNKRQWKGPFCLIAGDLWMCNSLIFKMSSFN